ncbi:unnamed protein product [Coffea canephora]|uniref:Uncharacterized protein n=1 Tax=Coffea canephora TaxID=49390 RepID=A0A068U4E3_COFCA|nr:unnamed protein product [Coffea canephora]
MEEEEGTGKRQTTECDYDVVRKKLRTEGDGDQDQDDVMASLAWLAFDDQTVTELSELLDSSSLEASSSSAQQFNVKVRFIEDPYMTPVIFQSSSAYVTINGNEESCGSSYSDSDSTVMASVDMGSFRVALRKLARELNVDETDSRGAWGSDAAAEEEEEEVIARGGGWRGGNDYLEGIFVKLPSGSSDLCETTPSDGENMWVKLLLGEEDLLGGAR